jgi:ABC-2 type transport system permease protein
VFNRRHLLMLMVRRELRARYVGSKMGLAWSYINPLSRFLTFYFVFGIILGRGAIPHYAIHLFSGMVIVNFFTSTFNSGTGSINQNKSIVNKMPLPREMFPLASMLVSLYHIGPQLVILVAVCVGTGTWHPGVGSVIAVAMAFTIVILFATGMAVMFSAINVLYRDFTRVVQIFTNMLPFTVPMMYPYAMVAARFGTGIWYRLYFDNPLADAVLLMQRAFWYQTIGPKDQHNSLYSFQYGTQYNFPAHLYTKGLIMILIGVVFVCVAQSVFNRLDDKLPDRLAG